MAHEIAGYEIFWDNGQWVAIRDGETRRNIAPHNCQTRREAELAARWDRDGLRPVDPDEERCYA